MIITIAGDLGSGKSTVGKLLADALQFTYFSTGNFMSELAKERGVSKLELCELAKVDPTIDKQLDDKQILFGQTTSNAVLDSRLGWYFIPESLKIYLTVTLDESANRIYAAQREDEQENFSLEATRENIVQRKETERVRYKQYYDLDYDNPTNFHLVLDTTQAEPQEVVDRILRFIEQRN